MRTKKLVLSVCTLLLFVSFAFAQVTGVVVDEFGPLEGALVTVNETGATAETNSDGEFNVNANVGDNLSVMNPLTLAESTFTVSRMDMGELNITQGAIVIEDFIVEGYRTTTKEKSNIASTTVSADKIESRPNASVMQTLQSQVSGLNIMTGSGQPGATSSVTLRGLGSINGKTEPLYVIDGVPLDDGAFRSLNPNEIENVSVLKDAGATAIYGNRGANGVIIITTKRGKFGQDTKFSYTATTGITEMQDNDYNLMNAKELLQLEKRHGIGYGATLSYDEIESYDINTDWHDEFFRKGFSQDHTFSVSSGGENVNAFTSLGYLEQEGILKNTDLKRFNFRNNLNGRTNDGKFNYGSSVTINYSRRNEATSLGTGSVNQNFVLGANNSVPYLSPGLYQGSQHLLELYQSNGTLLYTPLFLQDKMETFSNKIEETKAILNLDGGYNFTDALKLTTNVGLSYTQSNSTRFQDPISFNSLLFLEQGQEFGGFETHSMWRELLANVTTKLGYSKTFADKHTIEVAALTEYFKAHYRSHGLTQNGLDPKTSTPGGGTGWIDYDNTPNYVPSISASKIDAGLFSYFGYVDYDFDERYGVGVTVRRDASFRFNDTNKWGTFWSVSGRWSLNNEEFMEGSAFNILKLRGSYGTTGNQYISGSSIFSSPSLSQTIYSSVTGYGSSPAYGIVQLGNDALKWETVTQANVGLDFEVWRSRLVGSVDVYEKKTEDLYQGVRISAINAITQINANYGTLKNRGVELMLKYDVVKNDDFKFSVNMNGSYNKNEIGDLPEEDGLNWDGESLVVNREGDMLNQWYLLKYAGVNAANGHALYYDADGNLTETPDPGTDRYFTGKSSIPVYQGGFGFDLDYKGFYVSSLFSFVKDVYRMDWDYQGLVDPSNIGTFNMSTDILDAWTPENTNTHIPSLDASTAGSTQSDRFLKDASYLRLRYISLGYNFSDDLLGSTFIDGARIFVQGENLVTWSEWRGWDAESNRLSDQYQYPTPRIYSIGVEFNF